MNAEPTVRNAARLTYKTLHTTLSPINDSEYRELLALCRADPTFRRYVEDVAAGMELQILDLSEQRGLIVVPASKDSRFAVRLTDIRSGMTPDQKAALVLAHIAISAVFCQSCRRDLGAGAGVLAGVEAIAVISATAHQ